MLLTLLTTPMYRASVLVELQKEGTQVVQVGAVQPGDFGGWDPEFLQTQYKLIQSRSLAERVANELNLDQATLDSLNQPGWFGRMYSLLRPQSKDEAKVRAAEARQDAQQQLNETAGYVRGGLSVEPVRDSRLVKINYDSTVPGFSVRVANAVAEGFIASGLERRFGATSYAKTYLEDQLQADQGEAGGLRTQAGRVRAEGKPGQYRRERTVACHPEPDPVERRACHGAGPAHPRTGALAAGVLRRACPPT